MTKEDDIVMERRMTTVETVLTNHVKSCDDRAKRLERYQWVVISLLLAYAVKVIFHIPL